MPTSTRSSIGSHKYDGSGIDEISYKRGYRYLTVVVDHDTGQLIWAAPGRDLATLNRFFDALGAERTAQITHISADGADWIANVTAERCPQAIRSTWSVGSDRRAPNPGDSSGRRTCWIRMGAGRIEWESR